MADYEDGTAAGDLNPADKLKRFLDWHKLSAEALADQFRNAEEDINFQRDQWTAEARKARAGRPTLQVSLLNQPMQLILSQATAARPGVELHAVSETSDPELAEVKQGLYGRIQRDGGAEQARLWALSYAVNAGLGWYRIGTKYDEDSDHPSDTEICYERVLHQNMIFPDPAAQKADFSDGRFLIAAAYVPLDTFREWYPQAERNNPADFEAIRREMPAWVGAQGGECAPLVAEVFYKVPKPVTFKHGEGDERTRTEYVVWRAVCTGTEILSDEPWMKGRRYIPFVPVVGRELQPVGGKRYWEGLVRPARNAQEFHNAAVSTFVERMMMEPKTPFIVDMDAIGDYTAQWDDANSVNQPYLPYNSKGGTLPPPQRAQLDSSGMSMALMGLQQGREWVQSTTAVHEPSLGQAPRSRDAQSGRAIMALQGQSDAGTSYYLDNVKTISLPLDARIVLDMMEVVYDRPGRITQVLGMDDEPKSVMIGAPFVMKDGRPVKAPPGAPGAKSYDLTKGRYSIVATVGKNAQTRLQQGQEFLTAVIQAVPALMPIVGDLVFKFRDEPGAREISDRLRREIQAKMPHLLESKDGEEDMAAKAAAAMQQVQMLTQQVQQMGQAIQTEQVKHQANYAIAQLEAQKAVRIAELNAENRLEIARLTAARDATSQVAEAREEVVNTTLKTAAEKQENALDRAHEERMQMREMAHDVGMAAAGGSSLTLTTEPQEQAGGGAE